LEFKTVEIQAPHGVRVSSRFGWEPARQRAWIESAQALGLDLIPLEKRHPLELTSYGLGELLLAANKLQPHEILVGLGSSGTVDGGMGLASALGYRFYDAQGNLLSGAPQDWDLLEKIEPALNPVAFPVIRILADVRNPLLGEAGGVRVFSAQKGASAHEIERLEKRIQSWLKLLLPILPAAEHCSRLPGAGAAGGLGFALAALTQAILESGAERVIQESDLEQAIANADLVITGEGAYDAQSAWGKWPQYLIQTCQKYEKPVCLVTGQTVQLQDRPEGLRQTLDLVSLNPQCAVSKRASLQALHQVGYRLASEWKLDI